MAYEKQTWVTGEVITEEKLNHMEDGIDKNKVFHMYLGDTPGATTSDFTFNELKSYINNGYGVDHCPPVMFLGMPMSVSYNAQTDSFTFIGDHYVAYLDDDRQLTKHVSVISLNENGFSVVATGMEYVTLQD